MRTFLLAASIFVSSTGSLFAFDFLRGSDHDWSGFHVGGHAGQSWGETGNSWRNALAGYPTWQPDGDISYDSASGGVHAGYLWQQGWFAYGVEGDFTWASLKGDDRQFAGRVNGLEMDHFGTVRARLGVVQGRALVFATGGIAFSEIDKKDLTVGRSNSNDLVGWVVGGGFEYALFSRVRARVEYQYIDFGSVVSGLDYDHRADDVDIQSVRAGVSYGF